jgi:hypothetical protein
MAKKIKSKKLLDLTAKISNIGDLLMADDNHDWEIDELRFTNRHNPAAPMGIVCKWEKKAGKWVLLCKQS